MKYRILVLSLITVLSGCASSIEDNRQSFKSRLDFIIGRLIYTYGDTPYRILDTNDPAIKNYMYRDDTTGCQWMVVVELQTIKSWKYLSDPDLCTLKVNWSGPW